MMNALTFMALSSDFKNLSPITIKIGKKVKEERYEAQNMLRARFFLGVRSFRDYGPHLLSLIFGISNGYKRKDNNSKISK